MKRNWKDIWIRAGKTFAQAAIACIGAALSGVNFMVGDQTSNWWISILVSAGAAGLSAVWNSVFKPIYELPPGE